MKRCLSAGFLILSFILLIFTVSHSRSPRLYSSFDTSQAEIEQIKSSRKQTDRQILNYISFNDYPLFYDEKTSDWFYSVNKTKPELQPTVAYSSNEDRVRIAFSARISPGKDIPFIAYTDTVYREYKLIVTTLPLVHIENPEQDYLTGIDTETTYPIKFTVFDNRPDSHYPFVRSDATVHIRGEISRFFEKKSFRIHLTQKNVGKEISENNIPLLGMRQDGDWILYSAYNDQEKIRNVFTTNLWFESCSDDNNFGLKNGSEYRFVELFWNNQYCGLYAIGYPVDTKVVNVRPDAMGHYYEFLFKQKHWGPKTDGPDPNYDGLILQHDALQTDVNNGIQLTKMYFNMLENGAKGGFWNNDEKNVIDIWLFIKLIQGSGQVNHDFPGKLRNMYITVKQSETGSKILYTPWDLDISWGNITNTFNPSVKNYTMPYVLDVDDNSYEMTVNPVSVLREKDPQILRLIKKRYSELRTDGWSETAIDILLDDFEQDIFSSGAYLREMERWPEGSYEDPSLGLSVFREYVHNRLHSMDRFIDTLELSSNL